MAIRVRVNLSFIEGTAAITTAAVANAGYESLVPEAVLPKPLAAKLGLPIKRMRSATRMIARGKRITVRLAVPT